MISFLVHFAFWIPVYHQFIHYVIQCIAGATLDALQCMHSVHCSVCAVCTLNDTGIGSRMAFWIHQTCYLDLRPKIFTVKSNRPTDHYRDSTHLPFYAEANWPHLLQ